MDKNIEAVKNLTEEFLKLLLIEGGVNVTTEDESVSVHIDTEQSGAIIGYHGEGLIAFQLILNIIANKDTGAWQRIVVNVGDYRQKREEYLKNLALNVAERVKSTNQPTVLTNLSSFERRIIHICLSEDNQIESYSEGEGKDRKLIIKPKA